MDIARGEEVDIPSPSWLYPSVLQLPLCLLVRHSVSIVLVPVLTTLTSASASSVVAAAGKRKD
jgi:hypothetical protein